jgi:EAL domain-containing protein (putative c-di-GMP-specific phosphodiesterase class I)
MGDHTVRVTASVGAALGGADEADEDLLARADHAMHRAKEFGRDRASVYDDEAAKRHRPRPGVDEQLRRVLDSDGLQIRYQPVVDLDSRRVVGAEALLRVRGDEGEILSPAEFVEAAESSGLISRLGSAVLRTTCEQVTGLGRRGLAEGFEVSVNVSPRQVAHPQFADDVLQILEETEVAAPRLCLEITEGAFLGRDDASEGNILRLRERGVRIGLDEFGGYTSLGYLRRFPLDFVKIDRSIVAGIGGNYVDGAIVRATVELARKLDLTTVAVGVETEIQRQRLREVGCDRAQGYLFAPAVSADELPSLSAT